MQDIQAGRLTRRRLIHQGARLAYVTPVVLAALQVRPAFAGPSFDDEDTEHPDGPGRGIPGGGGPGSNGGPGTNPPSDGGPPGAGPGSSGGTGPGTQGGTGGSGGNSGSGGNGGVGGDSSGGPGSNGAPGGPSPGGPGGTGGTGGGGGGPTGNGSPPSGGGPGNPGPTGGPGDTTPVSDPNGSPIAYGNIPPGPTGKPGYAGPPAGMAAPNASDGRGQTTPPGGGPSAGGPPVGGSGGSTEVRGLPATGPQQVGGVQGGNGGMPKAPASVAGTSRTVLPSALPRTGVGAAATKDPGSRFTGASAAQRVPWPQAGLALALLLPGAGRVLATAARLRRLHTTVRRLVGEEATPQPGRNRRPGPS